MDTDKLLTFIAHGTSHDPFDQFLLANGIRKRPRGRDVTEVVEDKTRALTLSFEEREAFERMYLTPPQSEGLYCLESITFDERSPLTLPMGLSFSQSLEALEHILGKPIEINSRFRTGAVITYGWRNMLVIRRWNHTVPNEGFFRFVVIDKYSKERMGL